MQKDNIIFLRHILERAEKIIAFTKGMSEEDFMKDDKTQSAVVREIEVIGEAAKRVSDDFRQAHPEISWRLMSGMRDMLIHNYEGVDLLSVWATVQRDIPFLILALKKIIPNR